MNLSLFDDQLASFLEPLLQVDPVVDYTVRGLCARPYPLHPKGCPNIGKCDRCPPAAPFFDQAYDMEKPIFAVINEYNLAGHVKKMAQRNPRWSDRQLRCVLYWQNAARKQLNEKVRLALTSEQCNGYTATWCPEGMGINVTETLANSGIALEWPPVKIVRQVALLGRPLGAAR